MGAVRAQPRPGRRTARQAHGPAARNPFSQRQGRATCGAPYDPPAHCAQRHSQSLHCAQRYSCAAVRPRRGRRHVQLAVTNDECAAERAARNLCCQHTLPRLPRPPQIRANGSGICAQRHSGVAGAAHRSRVDSVEPHLDDSESMIRDRQLRRDHPEEPFPPG